MTESERKQAEEDVQRGRDAQRVLEQDDADRAAAQASDLAAFKALSAGKRTELFRLNPDRYRQLATAWRDEAEQMLLQKGGR